MPTYVTERDVPGADRLTARELKEMSAKSNEVVAGPGIPYEWITSYAVGDKLYCLHEAESAGAVRRHANQGRFPINKVTEIAPIIDPAAGQWSVLRHGGP